MHINNSEQCRAQEEARLAISAGFAGLPQAASRLWAPVYLLPSNTGVLLQGWASALGSPSAWTLRVTDVHSDCLLPSWGWGVEAMLLRGWGL